MPFSWVIAAGVLHAEEAERGREAALELDRRMREQMERERLEFSMVFGTKKLRYGDGSSYARLAPVRHASCPSCGAPSEPGRCSYCLTPA